MNKKQENWKIPVLHDTAFDTTTENTIKVLREGFAEYGIPDETLTDFEQFVAAEGREKAKHKFREFLAEKGVRHFLPE